MGRSLEWILAVIGATISLGGAGAVVALQPAQLWPLPALVLIDWAILGVVGFVAIALNSEQQSPRWGKTVWAVCGALLAVTVIGALSIGPLALSTGLAFGSAGVLGYARQNRKIATGMSLLAVGFVLNFALLFALLLIVRS